MSKSFFKKFFSVTLIAATLTGCASKDIDNTDSGNGSSTVSSSVVSTVSSSSATSTIYSEPVESCPNPGAQGVIIGEMERPQSSASDVSSSIEPEFSEPIESSSSETSSALTESSTIVSSSSSSSSKPASSSSSSSKPVSSSSSSSKPVSSSSLYAPQPKPVEYRLDLDYKFVHKQSCSVWLKDNGREATIGSLAEAMSSGYKVCPICLDSEVHWVMYNLNTNKYHELNCNEILKMDEANKWICTIAQAEATDKHSPCKKCH